MFESAELGTTLSKEKYKKEAARLRVELLRAQHALADSPYSLVVVLGGVEGAGRTDFVNLLMSWMDARGVETHALDAPTDEEKERPFFWRFWRLLPARRRGALFLTSWYTEALISRVLKTTDQATLDERLARVVEFERMLVQEKTILIKLWFHLTKKDQRRRLESLASDPATRWRVSARDWRFHDRYKRFRKVCEHALMKTGTAEAPWTVIDASNRHFRDVSAAGAILEGLRARLAEKKDAAKPAPDRPKPQAGDLIAKLDLSLSLSEKKFEKRMEELQGELGFLARKLRKSARSLVLAFEGPDAAGKGGAIRRLTAAMDARLYTVHSVAAPTEEERAHPYLWRFWRDVPRRGRVSIYDRTWYGRVLVERVEGFAAPQEWRRAFDEINAFEEQLAGYGMILLKFWLAISPEEQLRRFKSRVATPYKQYKLTPEDWRNREKWRAYEAAACEMIEKTSVTHAPWILVEGEDKRWARVKILETVVKRLKEDLA